MIDFQHYIVQLQVLDVTNLAFLGIPGSLPTQEDGERRRLRPLRHIDDLFETGDTESDVLRGHSSVVERVEGHLCGWLTERLCRQCTHVLARLNLYGYPDKPVLYMYIYTIGIPQWSWYVNMCEVSSFQRVLCIHLTCACWNRASISPIIHSKASVDSLCSSAILRAHNVERSRMLNKRVAFFWASRERWSFPFTITSLLLSSWTSG